MIEFFYTMFVIGVGSSVGLALVASEMHRRMYTKTRRAKEIAYILIRIGVAITNGILLIAVAAGLGENSTPPDWRSWGYLVGLAIITVGMWIDNKETIIELSRLEVEKEDGDNLIGDEIV